MTRKHRAKSRSSKRPVLGRFRIQKRGPQKWTTLKTSVLMYWGKGFGQSRATAGKAARQELDRHLRADPLGEYRIHAWETDKVF
jgi:hypothetical protein